MSVQPRIWACENAYSDAWWRGWVTGFVTTAVGVAGIYAAGSLLAWLCG
jgi:hypothetical protein